MGRHRIIQNSVPFYIMNILLFISEFIIPAIFFYIVALGISKKIPVYEEFVTGAKSGLKTVIELVPTMVGLMVGVKVLRASGILDEAGNILGKVLGAVIPSQIVPVIIVRLFSSSAATGLCLDIFKTYGADSYSGMLAGILMSCTESVFYTMSVYYMAAKITKTRWTLAGALIATFAGIAASVILTNMIM